jgi:hypothetical protein
MQNRFAHGLAGDGSGVDASSAKASHLLDYGNALAQFGGMDGRALSRGARTGDNQIVSLHLKEDYRKRPKRDINFAANWRPALGSQHRFSAGPEMLGKG